MLPKKQRLTTKQVDKVIGSGKVVHTNDFWLKFVKDIKETRISAIVPQKIAKTAVQRNENRRSIYKALRVFIDQISGIHAVITAKASIIDKEQAVFNNSVKDIFVKAGLLA